MTSPDPADYRAHAEQAHAAQQAGADSSTTSPDDRTDDREGGKDERGVTSDDRALAGNDDAVAASTPAGTDEDSPTGTTPTGTRSTDD